MNFSIVGTGMIANAMADSMTRASGVRLRAVSSRRQASADAFVAERPGVEAIEGIDGLWRRDVDAVYVATPTTAKEAIAMAAIEAGKHVLVDKPFVDADSVGRIAAAAAARGLLFMDATHFVHHPRTAAITSAAPELLGEPRSLHTAFYFPVMDRSNIRLMTDQEPTGALGDMAWYSMRAIVEYLRPRGPLSSLQVHAEIDEPTGAIVRATGVLAFEGGQSSTFDVGYTAGALVMDLTLLGAGGMIAMDDFVLDWQNSFAFQNPSQHAGFTHRHGMASRGEFTFHATPSEIRADVAMIERFAALVATPDPAASASYVKAARRTQELLDRAQRHLQALT